MTKERLVILSPILVIIVNLCVAVIFGQIIGKWAFIPMMLIGWFLWTALILKFGGVHSVKKWLQKPSGKVGWSVLAVFMGLIPLPIFLLHSDSLARWTVWLPWIVLALVNPWIEEFYWRGLLLDYTRSWAKWSAVLYTSAFFAINHLAFGINSEINSGYDVLISTFIMGIVWAWVYLKTNSLRWAVFSHFMVDFFNLSAAAFLDLFEKGSW